MVKTLRQVASAAFLVLGFLGIGCNKEPPRDDADGRKPDDFPEIGADLFNPMDGGIVLSPEAIKGRNTWILWCAGTEQFWDRMARESFGLIDLLKTIDSRKRSQRFKEMGLINQPGFRAAVRPNRYGLYLDEPIEPEPGEIDRKVYGRPTGIMGFRVFDNPDFKGKAVTDWNAEKYYNDAGREEDRTYAITPGLVRPYRVGISCGACHVAFNPCHPPADPENPTWADLASAIGNQYIREGRTFAPNVRPGRFFFEMLDNQPAGTSDTSRITTDHINNPNAINAIFLLGERLRIAHRQPVAGDTLNLPDVTSPMLAPAVLKDGADSVGVAGAVLRVYVNIGSYSQYWLQQHNPLIGLWRQEPFLVAVAQKNSVYWRATEQKVGNIGAFFSQLQPFRLKDSPGGTNYITTNDAVIMRGKIVFAENCAKCHSSKQPPADVANTKAWFRNQALRSDYWDNNFLSDDQPHPIDEIQTNAGRACGTNARRGHIWDTFSSEEYKTRASVGTIEVWNPSTGQMEKFTLPDGGPGFYRTPSLISVWSSAPLLHNNMLGIPTTDPSVAGRVRAFTDAMEKLLWPERRLGTNSIWRTRQDCWLELERGALPWYAKPTCDLLNVYCLIAFAVALGGVLVLLAGQVGHWPLLRQSGVAIVIIASLIIGWNMALGRHVLKIGPIPKGTPVNLLANFDPDRVGPWKFLRLAWKTKRVLLKIQSERLDSEQALRLMRVQLARDFWMANKCPDFVEDRGHTFGRSLPDNDKLALIEFVKSL